ncbi:MAG: tetratricopeptide repeat protein [Candidatus Odinarchaeota archaeon]
MAKVILTKDKKNKIKSIILVGILDITAIELFRYMLQIPPSLIYYFVLLALFIPQLGFVTFINYIQKKKDRPKQEYQINDYLTLKLEDKATNIYINGKQFIQCKYLLLKIPVDMVRNFDDIESIDEAAERLNSDLEFQSKNKIKISPETEFWAHCSNLQVWTEYNYNPRLLHSNLAFPLLNALTDAGDPIAKEVFKQEIKLRFESFNPSTQQCLIEIGYLDYFNKEEREELFKLILDENVWIKFGYNYLNGNRLKKALESFFHARDINPINLETLLGIAKVYVRKHKYDRALQIYNEILEYYPENQKALNKKCLIIQQKSK